MLAGQTVPYTSVHSMCKLNVGVAGSPAGSAVAGPIISAEEATQFYYIWLCRFAWV